MRLGEFSRLGHPWPEIPGHVDFRIGPVVYQALTRGVIVTAYEDEIERPNLLRELTLPPHYAPQIAAATRCA